MGHDVIRYSEAFKWQVINEIESGKWRSFKEAQSHYGIGGHGTVSAWCKSYGKNALLGKVVRVESVDERDQMRALRERIGQLEKALADTKIQEVLYRGYFEALCRAQGIEDVEAIKKNIASTR